MPQKKTKTALVKRIEKAAATKLPDKRKHFEREFLREALPAPLLDKVEEIEGLLKDENASFIKTRCRLGVIVDEIYEDKQRVVPKCMVRKPSRKSQPSWICTRVFSTRR